MPIDLEMTKEEALTMLEVIVSASLDYSLDIFLVASKMVEDRMKVWRAAMSPKVSKAVRGLVDLFTGEPDVETTNLYSYGHPGNWG
jgi:hypothetical protein